MERVYLFLADGFEEIEALATVDIFRRASVEVQMVSITGNLQVEGAHGIKVIADGLFENISIKRPCLMYLPGGMPGTKNLAAHAGLKHLLELQYDGRAPIAAICAAPSILGGMNVLEGREAVCYPGFESELDGALLSEDKIVKSDHVYTAKAAGVAIQFALKLVEDLKSKEIAEKVRNSIFLD